MRSLLAASVALALCVVPLLLSAEAPVDRRALDDGITVDAIPTIDFAMYEWGVWQIDAQGRVRSPEEVASESPAFVHRERGVPGPRPELPEMVPNDPRHQVFDKPVVFFHSTRAMDVSLTVRVPNGRPWLYYPSATVGRVDGDPALRFSGRLLAPSESLPQGLALQAPPSGHWWQWLRGGGGNTFITLDGREAETFLFYDGIAPFARGFARRRGQVVPVRRDMDFLAWVVDGASITTLRMSAPGRIERTFPPTREVLQREIRERLVARGLTPGIADSLLFTWRRELFGSPDRRVIWMLSPAAYDAMLPVEVVPRPQHVARVGVVIEKF